MSRKNKNRTAGKKRKVSVSAPASARPFVVLAALSGAGAVVSVLLIWMHLDGAAELPGCSIGGWFDCRSVAASRFSEFLGLPVAFWGLVAFAAMTGLSLQAVRRPGRRPAVATHLRLMTLAAGAVALYLALQSVFSLRALCLWCLVLDVLLLAILLVAWSIPNRKKGWPALLGRDVVAALRGRNKWLTLAVAGLAVGAGVWVAVLNARAGGARMAGRVVEVRGADGNVSVIAGQVHPGRGEGKQQPAGPHPNPDGPLVLLFSDFECPYCARFAPVFERLARRYSGRANFVFKHFPLDSSCNPAVKKRMHRNACLAARAAYCAAQQGAFWPFHDAVFSGGAGRRELEREARSAGLDVVALLRCAESLEATEVVERDIADGLRLGVRSTPTLVVGGHLVSGSTDERLLARLIEKEIAEYNERTEERREQIERPKGERSK